MKILQSSVERLLYIVLLFTFIGVGISDAFLYHIGNELKSQQIQFHNNSVTNLMNIKDNQKAESVAIKTYIACLLTLNPQSAVPLVDQERVCFNEAPAIK